MENQGYFLCPNCGNKITNPEIYICPNCTYDFGQLISCNYLNESKNCFLTGEPCNIKGLNYENCQIFINKFHLGINPE